MKETDQNDSVLALYRTTIRNMLSSGKPGVVPNSSFRHASIIIEELVRSAQLRVSAFCGKLSPDVWSQPVLDQLQMAIRRGVDVQMILAAKPDIDPPFFLDGRIKVLGLVDTKFVNTLGHFTVVDGKSLRLEEDMKERKALFAANMPKIGGALDQIFSILREKATAT